MTQDFIEGLFIFQAVIWFIIIIVMSVYDASEIKGSFRQIKTPPRSPNFQKRMFIYGITQLFFIMLMWFISCMQ